MARGVAPMRRGRAPGRSTPTVTISSMKTSAFPWSSLGNTTAKSRAGANGMVGGSNEAGGYEFWSGEDSTEGSQSLHRRMAFVRSQITSEIDDHSEGQGVPPNVRRRLINSIFILLITTHIRLVAAAKAEV